MPARRWRSVVFPEPEGPVTTLRRPEEKPASSALSAVAADLPSP
jgi:hypothetical protein